MKYFKIISIFLLLALNLNSQNSKQISGLYIGYTFRDNSLDFIDIDIAVVNGSKKAIKYITFYFEGYNSVDDKVGMTKILKGIGPINYMNRGVYNFENVWLTNIVETISIPQIKVEYMDKSVKIFKKGQYIKMDFDKINEIYETIEPSSEEECK